MELDSTRSAAARRHLDQARLDADLRVEDVQQTLGASRDDAWDLIFLDAERSAYTSYARLRDRGEGRHAPR